jgi:hypothetical protein
MTAQDDDQAPIKTPTEKLAELVARRKANAAAWSRSAGGRRQTEREAAAQSASKSKPALRK